MTCEWLAISDEGTPGNVRHHDWRPRVSKFADEFMHHFSLGAAQKISAMWMRDCILVNEKAVNGIGQAHAVSHCYYAGRCLCGRPSLCAFVKRRQAAMRKLFTTGSSATAALLQGRVAVRLEPLDVDPRRARLAPRPTATSRLTLTRSRSRSHGRLSGRSTFFTSGLCRNTIWWIQAFVIPNISISRTNCLNTWCLLQGLTVGQERITTHRQNA